LLNVFRKQFNQNNQRFIIPTDVGRDS